MDPYEFAVGERDGEMVMANRWGETTTMPMEAYMEMRQDYVRWLGQQGVENPRVPRSLEPLTDNVPSTPEAVAGLLVYYHRI